MAGSPLCNDCKKNPFHVFDIQFYVGFAEVDFREIVLTLSSGEPSVNQPMPPVEQETLIMPTPSPSSREPSVNQPTPPIEHEAQQPVQQGLEAQHALSAAYDEMCRLYVEDIVKRCTWMRSKRSELLHSPNIVNNVRSMATDLELELFSVEELQGFIQDIRTNPTLLNSKFMEYWPGRK